MTDHGFAYTCSGENKSVNMAIGLKWTDKDNRAKQINSIHYDAMGVVQTVKLNSNIGVINIPNMFFRTTKGIDPSPGYTEGNFIIKIWEP
ncbi:hypothetical protein CF106_03445 [Aeromonas veronii]|nr:hypothetical protein CF106_03445 [Aeromonas veronii]